MGRTAGFILARNDDLPADLGDWIACQGASGGWAGFARATVEPAHPGEPWEGVTGPYLVAFVLDSDYCELVAWDKGSPVAAWVINPEAQTAFGLGDQMAEPGSEQELAERVQTICALELWCRDAGLPNPDPGQLDELLGMGWILADEGLLAQLSALGLVPEGNDLLPEQPLIDLDAFAHLMYSGPADLDLADGLDATTLPGAPRRIILAAPIVHDSPFWSWFVISQELEGWGKPACIVADSLLEVAPGELNAWPTWMLYLASDPAVSVGAWMGPLGSASHLPETGPWVLVPEASAVTIEQAVDWARAHVGTCVEPPADSRMPVEQELVSPSTGLGFEFGARASDLSFGFELSTYADLLERADEVADWLEEARRQLIAPFAAAFEDRLVTEPAVEDEGPAYGASISLYVKSLRERGWSLPATDAGWERALELVRRGELRSFQVTMTRYNGLGQASMYRYGLRLEVELRDQFSSGPGPLADGNPAKIVVSAPKPLLDGARDGWVKVILGLMRSAATAFDAAYGYATADGHGVGGYQSTYESRHGLVWDESRLDGATRGAHWGTLLGPGHLARIGGEPVLQLLLEQGSITSLRQWGRLWFLRLTEDPFDADRELADRLAEVLLPIMPAHGENEAPQDL